MSMAEVADCMEQFYRFECGSKDVAKRISGWIVEGRSGDWAQAQKDGVVRIKRANG